MPQTSQKPQHPAPAAREYVLYIPETQMPASHAIQLAQQSQVAFRGQQLRGHLLSYRFVDKQQPSTSRQLHFTISPAKHFNSLSVASVTGEESTNNISALSSIFGNIQSVMSYPQMDTPQPLTPLLQPPSSKSINRSQPSPSQPAIIRAQAEAAVNLLHLPTVCPFLDHCCKMSFFRTTAD